MTIINSESTPLKFSLVARCDKELAQVYKEDLNKQQFSSYHFLSEEDLYNMINKVPHYVHFSVIGQDGRELTGFLLSEFISEYADYNKDATLHIFSEALESYDFKDRAVEWLKAYLPEYLQ